MYPVEPDILNPLTGPDVYIPVLADGGGMLGYLIALRQIRIKIILSGEIVSLLNIAVTGQPHLNGMTNGLAVHFGQGAWMRQRNGADMGIGGRSKSDAVGAE